MNLHNAEFIISAVSDKQYPKGELPELAMVGRSNVGKSSLINKILNRKNFARVSSKPGKTTTINFYSIDKKLMLVDLPGYGYAKVSKKEKEKWGGMIEFYLKSRDCMKAIFLLVDSRHEPSEDDIIMLKWIRAYSKNFYVVATKSDKLKPSQKQQSLDLIKEIMIVDDEHFISFSSETGEGKDRILAILENLAL